MVSTIKDTESSASLTARRRDRIPCIQACHPSEVALRIHFACCIFLSIELRVQCPAREPPDLLDLGRGRQLSRNRGDCTASSFPTARSMSSLSDAIPCLQSSCRNRGLIGESGRDAAIDRQSGKIWILYSVPAHHCLLAPGRSHLSINSKLGTDVPFKM